MITSPPTRRTALWAACVFALGFSAASKADDMASFATAGYASGLHSMALMHKIDTDGDGMVSKDEWLAFHEKVFAMLDKDKSGNVNAKEFISPSGGDLTGFCNRRLRARTTHQGHDAQDRHRWRRHRFAR